MAKLQLDERRAIGALRLRLRRRTLNQGCLSNRETERSS